MADGTGGRKVDLKKPDEIRFQEEVTVSVNRRVDRSHISFLGSKDHHAFDHNLLDMNAHNLTTNSDELRISDATTNRLFVCCVGHLEASRY